MCGFPDRLRWHYAVALEFPRRDLADAPLGCPFSEACLRRTYCRIGLGREQTCTRYVIHCDDVARCALLRRFASDCSPIDFTGFYVLCDCTSLKLRGCRHIAARRILRRASSRGCSGSSDRYATELGRPEWSFPKGHRRGGESLEDAALREVEEETGWRCVALAEAGSLSYQTEKAGRKDVHFWIMRAFCDVGQASPAVAPPEDSEPT